MGLLLDIVIFYYQYLVNSLLNQEADLFLQIQNHLLLAFYMGGPEYMGILACVFLYFLL